MACVLPDLPRPRPMTTPAERAEVFFANALLPAPLLPTPPRSKMLPLLPTPCLVILPTSQTKSPPPKPGRADADERWDACKNAAKAPSSSSAPGRADAVERWDARKVKQAQSTSSSSSSSSSNSATTSRASTSSQKWKINKQRAVSRAASAERWDARKQPRPVQVKGPGDDDDKSSTGSNDVEVGTLPQGFYAGSGFIASPEPGMLPVPSFMVRVA